MFSRAPRPPWTMSNRFAKISSKDPVVYLVPQY
jgi:hypothetical protein